MRHMALCLAIVVLAQLGDQERELLGDVRAAGPFLHGVDLVRTGSTTGHRRTGLPPRSMSRVVGGRTGMVG